MTPRPNIRKHPLEDWESAMIEPYDETRIHWVSLAAWIGAIAIGVACWAGLWRLWEWVSR